MSVNKRSAGRYRHRVTLYDPNTSPTDSGYPAEAAVPVGGVLLLEDGTPLLLEDGTPLLLEDSQSLGSNLPAWVYGVGGGEPLRDQQVEAHITHIVELRYLSGVKQKQYLLWGSRRLNIEKIIDKHGRQRELILHCVELGN